MFARLLVLAASAFTGIGMVLRGGRANAGAPSEECGRWNGSASEFLHLDGGVLSGSDGCNGVGGFYAPNGQGWDFRRGFSTMRACPGVDTWLQRASRVTVDGDTMTVFDKDGVRLGILTRAG